MRVVVERTATLAGLRPSVTFDGEDEPGDPSGLTLSALGLTVGLYWRMSARVAVEWTWGSWPRVTRW